MMTPACPRLLDMINDFVFCASKRYRSYILLLLLLLSEAVTSQHIVLVVEMHVNNSKQRKSLGGKLIKKNGGN